jgi:hypothetical protein
MTDQAENPHPSLSGKTQTQRVQEAQRHLMNLTANKAISEPSSWVPAWSSTLLEQTLDGMLATPGWRLRDILYGLWELLGYTRAPLTKTTANFIKDIVVYSFTRYRSRYESEQFGWMEASLSEGCTEAQAYFALHVLPESLATKCRQQILRALRDTDYFDEALRSLSD